MRPKQVSETLKKHIIFNRKITKTYKMINSKMEVGLQNTDQNDNYIKNKN